MCWFFNFDYDNLNDNHYLERSGIIFENVKQFIQFASDTRSLELVLGSTSCLAMILESDDDNEVSILIDFLSNLSFIDSKYFFLQMTSGLDENLLSNKTINFDVTILETSRNSEGKHNFFHNLKLLGFVYQGVANLHVFCVFSFHG